jgi:hypothetical protein
VADSTLVSIGILSKGAYYMHRRSIVAPLVVIAVVVGVLLVQRGSPMAEAQAPLNRARGEYTLVSGRLNSGGPQAIYVLDSSNNELIALRWDPSRQTLAGIGYRNLSSDTNLQIGR